MLAELPAEIVSHIAQYLPSASAYIHLAQSCRRLYKIIIKHDASLFRAFVQNQFPSIQTPPYWKDAVCALASRSRALDRLGITARFVVPPDTTVNIGIHDETRRDNPTLGYRPPIDSYEVWNGGSWADRKEVLAWGAGHRLVMRIKQSGTHPREDWLYFNDQEHVSSYDDICGLHIMNHDDGGKAADIEQVIFGRVRGDIQRLALSPGDATYESKQKFLTGGLELSGTDRSDGSQPVLSANFDNGSLALYQTNIEDEEVEPFAWIRSDTTTLSRSRCSKLLSSSRIAVSTGKPETALVISTISPEGISPMREITANSLDIEAQANGPSHATVSSIAPLNAHGLAGSPGDVFLAAWGDRAIRLHDIRSPCSYERTYRDTADNHLIYCLQPFGHDSFLAGSGGDALVKIFDLRMDKGYSYLDASAPRKSNSKRTDRSQPPRKDFSVFLSARSRILPHNPRQRRVPAYRGPIYSMSTPSPSSSTVYTGIVDGVVRLDFISTDDLTGPAKEWYHHNLDLGIDPGSTKPHRATNEEVFNLAGYERPDPNDLTTTSKLRTQHRHFWPTEGENGVHEAVDTGWDRRWENLEEPGAWRRRDA